MKKYIMMVLPLTLIIPSYLPGRTTRGLALKNFREILTSYEAITGVSATDAEIQAIYRSVKERLPLHGKVEELSSPMVLASTELSGIFCSRVLEREVAQGPGERVFFRYVDFKKGSTQFSSGDLERVIDDIAIGFWQRPVTEAEKEALLASFTGAIGSHKSSPGALRNAFQVICTLFATSLEFFVK